MSVDQCTDKEDVVHAANGYCMHACTLLSRVCCTHACMLLSRVGCMHACTLLSRVRLFEIHGLSPTRLL